MPTLRQLCIWFFCRECSELSPGPRKRPLKLRIWSPAGESLRKDAEELVKQSGMRLEIRLQGLPLGFASFCLCLGERDDGGYVSGSLSWFWGFGGQQDLPENCQNDAGDPAEFCFPGILQTSEMPVCVRNTTGRKKPSRDLIRDVKGRL